MRYRIVSHLTCYSFALRALAICSINDLAEVRSVNYNFLAISFEVHVAFFVLEPIRVGINRE